MTNLKNLILLLLFALNSDAQGVKFPILKPNNTLTNFRYDRPLFKFDEDQSKNNYRHLRFFAITGYREGILPIQGLGSLASNIDTANGTVRTYMINLSIQNLLTLGFGYPNNRFLLEVEDESKYRYTSNLGSRLEWMRENAYCLEYLRPVGVYLNINTLKLEIARYFGVTLSKEKRSVDVLVLSKTSRRDKLACKNKAQKSKESVSFNILSKLIDTMDLPKMVNETGYDLSLRINIDLENIHTLSDLQDALRKYDLTLKREKREIELLVIREINK